MNARLPLIGLMIASTFSAAGQCTIDLPQDTVTLYSGYAPLSCITLTPTVDGAEPTSILWSNGDTTTSLEVCDTTASTWYYVTLTDDTLCTATDSAFVNVVDVHCGNNGNKVLVCHIPPGNPANAHTICISENGVPAHLAHGCVLGACATEAAGDSIDGGGAADMQLEVSPNPLNETATVRVRSSVTQRVRVSVVDALGRRSSLLFDAEMLANEERVLVLDQGLLPQGTSAAWIEVQADSGRLVRQLVLVR